MNNPSNPDACRVCGCTELAPCTDRDGAPCSWAGPDQTICNLCEAEEIALLRAGKGVRHIFDTFKGESITIQDVGGALVAAYLAGAADEHFLWKAWLTAVEEDFMNPQPPRQLIPPRDIASDIREPRDLPEPGPEPARRFL